MKCEAKTTEGKRCTLNGSVEVGGHHYCGNHANKVRATQLFDRDKKQQEPEAKPRPPFVAPSEDEVKAADMLKTLRTLMQVNAPDRVLVAMMVAWKQGEL